MVLCVGYRTLVIAVVVNRNQPHRYERDFTLKPQSARRRELASLRWGAEFLAQPIDTTVRDLRPFATRGKLAGFASQDHLVGIVTGSGRPSQGSSLSILTEPHDELASSLHSMTSSARASSVGGMSRLSAFAVLRLMTNSNLVGCWTGRSPGLSPLRMRST